MYMYVYIYIHTSLVEGAGEAGGDGVGELLEDLGVRDLGGG